MTKPRIQTTLVVLVSHTTWASHEEWMPMAKQSWMLTTGTGRRIRFISVNTVLDALSKKRLFLQADTIVLTIFGRFIQLSDQTRNPVVSTILFENLVDFIRIHLGLQTPLIIHSHGEFSGGGVAYAKVERYLAPASFVCSSTSDLRALHLCYENANAIVAPYALARRFPNSRKRAPHQKNRTTRYVYAGRISEQKNLHQLLIACWILRQRDPKFAFTLDIYGFPDGLGSPNMGSKNEFYYRNLRSLTRRLKLTPFIHWRGFVPRSQLNKILARDGRTVVSPSLNSDESFGNVVFRALAAGNPVVLTAWGGHLDFAKAFPQQCHTVAVRESPAGPFISPCDLTDKLLEAAKKNYSPDLKAISNYSPLAVAQRLRKLLNTSFTKTYQRTILGKKVSTQHQRFEHRTIDQLPHVFTGYEDPLAQPFFRAWGMKRCDTKSVKTILVPPWVTIGRDQIRVRDPHRGFFSISDRYTPKKKKIAVITPDGSSTLITKSAANWLCLMGFAYEWDSS